MTRCWKYPQSPKLAEGRLTVSRAPEHRIYWHEYGNPAGEPVIFLHGGPGGGSDPEYARFFDPARYRVLLFDQRGCGKSLPSAAQDAHSALADNTTQHLIADIVKLRRHRGITGPAHVFGGSWGSTLALAYAITHPKQVKRLILRGIFLCRRQDLDYFYQGNAASFHRDPRDTHFPGAYQTFPGAWEPFVKAIPRRERGDMVAAYARLFALTPRTKAQADRQDAAARAWSVWEGATSFLHPDPEALTRFAAAEFARAFARIENHYFLNGAFFGGRDQNYVLEQVHRLAGLSIHIVQGIYDQVCPRFQADALVAALQAAGNIPDYRLTCAGHSALEPETLRALTEVMDQQSCAKPL